MAKIRILLLDDSAANLCIDRGALRIPDFNTTLPSIYSDIFEIIWITSPIECEIFRNLCARIKSKDPGALITVIPEILAMDYALTASNAEMAAQDQRQDKTQRRDRDGFAEPVEVYINRVLTAFNLTEQAEQYLPVSALHQIIKAAKKAAVLNDEEIEELSQNLENWENGLPPDVVYATNAEDRMGALAGALIYEQFANETPTALVAHTMHANVTRTETAWLEYLMRGDAGDSFERKGNKATNWRPLLTEGAQVYRKRLIELAAGGYVNVQLDELFALIFPQKDVEQPQTITVYSKFGSRTLPLAGLFIDADANNINDTQRKWASDLLVAIASRFNRADNANIVGAPAPDVINANIVGAPVPAIISEINEGLELSRRLFECWKGETPDFQRLRQQRRRRTSKRRQRETPDFQRLRQQRYRLCELADLVRKHWATQPANTPATLPNEVENALKNPQDNYDLNFKNFARSLCNSQQFYNTRITQAFQQNIATIQNFNEPECLTNAFDVCSGDYSPVARRWAILFTLRRLIAWKEAIERAVDNAPASNPERFEEYSAWRARSIDQYILADALFPLTRDLLVLPYPPYGNTGNFYQLQNKINNVLRPEEKGVVLCDHTLSLCQLTLGNGDPNNPGLNPTPTQLERRIMSMFQFDLASLPESNEE